MKALWNGALARMLALSTGLVAAEERRRGIAFQYGRPIGAYGRRGWQRRPRLLSAAQQRRNARSKAKRKASHRVRS